MHVDDEKLTRILDNMPAEETPAGMRGHIMSVVRGAARAPRAIGSRQRRRTTFIYGWAIAAAVVLGFVVFSSVRQIDDTVATMTAPNIMVEQNGRLIALTITSPGSISVSWAPDSADLVAISGATDTSSGKDQTTFTLQGPAARAVVTLRARSVSPVPVSVSVNGRETHRQTIEVN